MQFFLKKAVFVCEDKWFEQNPVLHEYELRGVQNPMNGRLMAVMWTPAEIILHLLPTDTYTQDSDLVEYKVIHFVTGVVVGFIDINPSNCLSDLKLRLRQLFIIPKETEIIFNNWDETFTGLQVRRSVIRAFGVQYAPFKRHKGQLALRDS